MAHIEYNRRHVEQDETFEPAWDYNLTFVRQEGMRAIFRDGEGEFSRFLTRTKPKRSRALMLGERRTVVEVVLDPRPTVDGTTVYVLTHQMCVPGGWQDVKHTRCRAPEHLAGIYYGRGSNIENDELRRVAEKLYMGANAFVDAHPFTEISKLLTTIRLQEGTGKIGGWNDPGLGWKISALLDETGTL
ncbi:hypothetical protein ACWDFH_19335 [Streptomyces kronopolitis]